MKIMKITLASAVALGMSAPAFAGGLDEPAIVAPVAPIAVAAAPVSYGADWTGGYVGASLGYADLEGSSTFGDDFNGGSLGLHAGYNYDMGSYVLGGEIEYSGFDVRDDASGQDLDQVLRAKVRAGYDAGSFMPYVTVGAAQAYTSGALGDLDGTGYLYGLGADYRVSDSITVGAEILRHEFEDFADTGIDLDANTASVRVSFNF
jgi:opacity protein-like surface antigen